MCDTDDLVIRIRKCSIDRLLQQSHRVFEILRPPEVRGVSHSHRQPGSPVEDEIGRIDPVLPENGIEKLVVQHIVFADDVESI